MSKPCSNHANHGGAESPAQNPIPSPRLHMLTMLMLSINPNALIVCIIVRNKTYKVSHTIPVSTQDSTPPPTQILLPSLGMDTIVHERCEITTEVRQT